MKNVQLYKNIFMPLLLVIAATSASYAQQAAMKVVHATIAPSAQPNPNYKPMAVPANPDSPKSNINQVQITVVKQQQPMPLTAKGQPANNAGSSKTPMKVVVVEQPLQKQAQPMQH
jgi:hypothetical protein